MIKNLSHKYNTGQGSRLTIDLDETRGNRFNNEEDNTILNNKDIKTNLLVCVPAYIAGTHTSKPSYSKGFSS